MSRAKDETGNRYGSLVVLERAGSRPDGKATWKCRCDCGNEFIAIGHDLRSGKTSRCYYCHVEYMRQIGKSNAKDITGKRFGRLVALRPIGSASYGGVIWECQCDCGNKHNVEYSNFMKGYVQSCGCLKSKGEMIIQHLLTQKQIDFQTQYTPKDWRLSSGYKPFYDFALFQNDKLICLLEFHGEQHRKFYTSTKTWNNEENFKKTQQRDKEKADLCKLYNIPLYIIWYDEDINESLLKVLNKENLTFNKNLDII